ncbi:MAG: hypothetical protein GW808_02865 [Sphingomonadales bacterium]|nr:hypothetical protein [Sphingomonadales bacterium]PIX66701.1 MAG: hypothetical protein COZ43_05425 [Sphingomonadales bacterium CG_4_10_14_3_um_filter_58_15]NCO99340.1 hypothetical protein [Sphingomonadales bacterium]NCP42791.1 hypothetical protein [Sphingomonadales bacterium]NCP48135.1 hypothetical protein [Sphingomonadales bacterium]
MNDKTTDALATANAGKKKASRPPNEHANRESILDRPIVTGDQKYAQMAEDLASFTPEELEEAMEDFESFGAGDKQEKRNYRQNMAEMQFGREEDFIGFMQEIAANASGSPLYDDDLVEELGKFLKSHFDRARTANTPPVPARRYVPRKDEIIPFLKEVWGAWLDSGHFSRPALREHDVRAYNALQNWLRNNEPPADMNLKTASEVTDEFLQRDYYRRDEVSRFVGALQRRGLKV